MKYAIVESGGKQYRAVEGEAIEVDRLPIPAGEEVKLDKVLLLVDGENITVGLPTVKDMNVFARVAEHFKGPKVVIFKYSPKKRIRVKTGHRQNYTRLEVEQIGSVKVTKVEKPAEVEQPKLVEAPAEPVKAPAKEKVAKAPKAAKTEKAPAETKAAKTVKTSKAPKKATKAAKTPKASAAKKPTKPVATPKSPAAKKPTKPAATSKVSAAKKLAKTTKTTTASKTKKPKK